MLLSYFEFLCRTSACRNRFVDWWRSAVFMVNIMPLLSFLPIELFHASFCGCYGVWPTGFVVHWLLFFSTKNGLYLKYFLIIVNILVCSFFFIDSLQLGIKIYQLWRIPWNREEFLTHIFFRQREQRIWRLEIL